MHALEKAALEDPFLADALEGYTAEKVRVPADLDELKKRLQEKVDDKKIIPISSVRSFGWLRAAAMIFAVAGAALLVYNLGSSNREQDAGIAQQPSTNYLQDRKNDADTVSNAIASSPQPPVINQDTTPLVKKNIQKEQQAAQAAAPVSSSPTSAPGDEARTAVVAEAKSAEERASFLADSSTGIQLIAQEKARQYSQKKQPPERSAARAGRPENGFMGYDNAAENPASALALPRRTQNFSSPLNVFRGKITDDQNNPLPFANITNRDDHVGTYSDAQGNFVLTSPDSLLNVRVHSLGFENSDVELQNGLSINQVTLKNDNSIAPIVLSNKKVNARMKEGTMVLEEPEPADGWTKYDTYLANNLKMPEDYKSRQQEGGEVSLSFEVNQLGEPVNIKVERSLCDVCDQEAIRLLKEGPKWKKKAKKGRRTTITIPF